ncbi:MAG TPA: hypothetical protein VFA03_08620 [Acetobacteraceae bacterium]|nr:hypothetical protein [Acetobacteraceae bacterium]
MGWMGGWNCCAPCWTPAWAWVLVNEIEADSSSPSAASFVGESGAGDATVEYFIDQGASSPAVTVTIVAGGSTTTWNASALGVGFHAHHFGGLHRGTKVTLTATNAMARLRWCEPVCC